MLICIHKGTNIQSNIYAYMHMGTHTCAHACLCIQSRVLVHICRRFILFWKENENLLWFWLWVGDKQGGVALSIFRAAPCECLTLPILF